MMLTAGGKFCHVARTSNWLVEGWYEDVQEQCHPCEETSLW